MYKLSVSQANNRGEMVAVQRINNEPEQTIFGMVSNGAVWQFGKLILDNFTQNKTFYTIQDLERLFAAINYVFGQCELQLASNSALR